MSAALAEHGNEQVRAAVDHFGLVGEFRHRVDHPQHLQHLDPGQLADGGLGRGEQAEADQLRVLVGLLDSDVAADLAGGEGAIGAPWPLAGKVCCR